MSDKIDVVVTVVQFTAMAIGICLILWVLHHVS